MNISGFYPESISNGGGGFRAVLYVSGCPHKCPMCQNEETQSALYGELYTTKLRDSYIKSIKENSILKGVTLSGGEPLWTTNLKEVLDFTEQVLLVRSELNIWIYSGYKYENLIKRECPYTNKLLSLASVLVDGKYVHSKRDASLKFKGSSNQRVIDLKKSSIDNVILWEEHSRLIGMFKKF